MVRIPRRPHIRTLAAAVAALLALGAATALGAQATDRPAFCSSCHEMEPYHAAWTRGSHRDVSCVDCHVDLGAANRIAHKAVALGEVWSHFFSDPRFPNGADVPDSRCVRCHTPSTIDPGVPGFDHERHRGERACVSCHDDVGHSVTATALAAAGVLDRAAYEARVRPAAPSQAVTVAATHPEVSCSTCHDIGRTACEQCHAPRHGGLAAATGSRPCTTCHTTGASWISVHPDDSQCQSCHVRPANHRSGPCSSCHATGSWRFTHPASRTCTSCHRAPANHYGTSCASCHQPAGSWAFRHPSSGECQSCHVRPANHRSGACTTCHNTRSWRFTHPVSTACQSCHQAPANHYGTSCASCHQPGTAWSRATFAHPRISGGKHTYRSFPCSKCHPSGYSSATCTACHKGDPDDDD